MCHRIAVCCLLTLAACASERIEAPHLIRVDGAAEAHWRALFAAEPGWIVRHLLALEDAEPARWPQLLAARLLHEGEAWNARQRQGRSRSASPPLAPPHAALRDAILRRLRWAPPQAELLPVYLAASRRDWSGRHLVALLDLIAALDLPAARARAQELAQPEGGAGQTGQRVAVQAWLLEHGGLGDDGLIDRILAAGGHEETRQLVQRLPQEALAPRLTALLQRLLAGVSPAELDPRTGVLVHACCQRLDAVPLVDILPTVLPLLAQGRRREVSVLASALARLPGETLPAQARQRLVGVLRLRLGRSDDLALRQSLLALLLAWDPAAVVEEVAAASPWSLLARHRLRLSGSP